MTVVVHDQPGQHFRSQLRLSFVNTCLVQIVGRNTHLLPHTGHPLEDPLSRLVKRNFECPAADVLNRGPGILDNARHELIVEL